MNIIDTRIHTKEGVAKYRICPICTVKLPSSSFSGDIDDWNDERLAIPCCACLKILIIVEKLITDFSSSRFKKTAVITEEYDYITTKVRGKTKWMYYKGHYTKHDLDIFLSDMLKYKYDMLVHHKIDIIIENLKIWGIIIMPKKEYKLKCFRCGQPIYSKEEAKRNRINRRPYCGECAANYYSQDQAIFEEEQFYKRFPTDQDYIDYKNKQKYGEC